MASDTDDNIIIETSGLTAAVATDVVQFAGAFEQKWLRIVSISNL